MMIETIVQKWLNELQYKKPVMIKVDHNVNILTITTVNPGILIGRYGEDIETLRKELGDNWKISLIEADEIVCSRCMPQSTLEIGVIL